MGATPSVLRRACTIRAPGPKYKMWVSHMQRKWPLRHVLSKRRIKSAFRTMWSNCHPVTWVRFTSSNSEWNAHHVSTNFQQQIWTLHPARALEMLFLQLLSPPIPIHQVLPRRLANVQVEKRELTSIDLESRGIEESPVEQGLQPCLVKRVGSLVDSNVGHVSVLETSTDRRICTRSEEFEGSKVAEVHSIRACSLSMTR